MVHSEGIKKLIEPLSALAQVSKRLGLIKSGPGDLDTFNFFNFSQIMLLGNP